MTFAALYLLQRLKTRFLVAWSFSGHCLFISAFMIASKVNQRESEICSYLKWQLNVEPSALNEFESVVQRDFKGPSSYPTHHNLYFRFFWLSTCSIPTAIPLFSPGMSSSPPSMTSLIPPREVNVKVVWQDVFHTDGSPSVAYPSHFSLECLLSANSMSPFRGPDNAVEWTFIWV